MSELHAGFPGALWIGTSADRPGEPVLARRIATADVATASVDAVAAAVEGAVALEHPSLVRVLGTERDDDELVVGSAWVEGELFSAIVRLGGMQRKPAPPRVVLAILLDVLEAASWLEEQGIGGGLHPDAVLVGVDGMTRRLEPGVGRVVATDPAWQKDVKRVCYEAPERLDGERGDARSEVFVAGVMLWEMLRCRPMFSGANFDAVAKRVKTEPIRRADGMKTAGGEEVPRSVGDLVERALLRDPSVRFATLAEMKRAVASERHATPAEVAEYVKAVAESSLAEHARKLERAQKPEKSSPVMRGGKGIPRPSSASLTPRASAVAPPPRAKLPSSPRAKLASSPHAPPVSPRGPSANAPPPRRPPRRLPDEPVTIDADPYESVEIPLDKLALADEAKVALAARELAAPKESKEETALDADARPAIEPPAGASVAADDGAAKEAEAPPLEPSETDVPVDEDGDEPADAAPAPGPEPAKPSDGDGYDLMSMADDPSDPGDDRVPSPAASEESASPKPAPASPKPAAVSPKPAPVAKKPAVVMEKKPATPPEPPPAKASAIAKASAADAAESIELAKPRSTGTLLLAAGVIAAVVIVALVIGLGSSDNAPAALTTSAPGPSTAAPPPPPPAPPPRETAAPPDELAAPPPSESAPPPTEPPPPTSLAAPTPPRPAPPTWKPPPPKPPPPKQPPKKPPPKGSKYVPGGI